MRFCWRLWMGRRVGGRRGAGAALRLRLCLCEGGSEGTQVAASTTDLRRRLPRGRYYLRAVVCLGIFQKFDI